MIALVIPVSSQTINGTRCNLARIDNLTKHQCYELWKALHEADKNPSGWTYEHGIQYEKLVPCIIRVQSSDNLKPMQTTIEAYLPYSTAAMRNAYNSKRQR